ncbi:hypothetical protein D3C71_1450820 [compost metagenome]
MLWADCTAVVNSSCRESMMSRRSCSKEVTDMIKSATRAVPIMSMIFILKLSLLMEVSGGAAVDCCGVGRELCSVRLLPARAAAQPLCGEGRGGRSR